MSETLGRIFYTIARPAAFLRDLISQDPYARFDELDAGEARLAERLSPRTGSPSKSRGNGSPRMQT
jgi:hypothetical protein